MSTNARTPNNSQGDGVTLKFLAPELSAFDSKIRRLSSKKPNGNCEDVSANEGSRKQVICSVISGQRMSEMRAEKI